mmetsp:Transcript_131093/g.261587  ORF Transcript_131093/g.261587 Transcript_131093/m.261587 type:complete len:762 (+) Transcript_131093:93-2378(+)|eukprot:CAMPEP_0172661090 /NCGR_PEP_ID=MMETSP1074-20121228/4464_1 /TAXON_ID=2916 /ORGANISM="Ceratium fusus, Strain PA161109" /LENGTH=761 /DNA_ID=CAMNT_0013476807 /DNA_START=16 /DNA_END=2301 /DNA_ORIENTATION=+
MPKRRGNPLLAAFGRYESLSTVVSLMNQFPDSVMTKDRNGNLPLHAALYRHVLPQITMAVLQAQPAAASAVNAAGDLPLEIALQKNAPLQIVIELLRIHPSAATVSNGHGDLPIHMALQSCAKSEVVNELLRMNPSAATAANASGYLPIHVAARKGAAVDILQKLLEIYPESASKSVDSGHLPFHLAVASHQTCQTVSALLEANPKAADTCLNGFPLHMVGDSPSPRLIQAMVDAYKVHVDGGTKPLHVALRKQAPWQIVAIVLHMHLEAASVLEAGKLPLHLAVSLRASPDTLMCLFKAYPKAACVSDSDGHLPLHIAMILDMSVFDVYLLLKLYVEAMHSRAALGDLTCDAYVTSIVIPVASYFARCSDLTGLSDIVELGLTTSNAFYCATVHLAKMSSDPIIRSVLRRWHHGCILWTQFRRQTLQRAVRSSSIAARIWSFLFNGCAYDDECYFVASTANKLHDVSEEFVIEHVSESELAVSLDTPTRALISDHVWAWNVERRVHHPRQQALQGHGRKLTPLATNDMVQSSEEVIQYIAHADPAAHIAEEEASQVVDVQQACFIERCLTSSAGIEEGYTSTEDTETVWISKINRNTKELREELMTGPSLRTPRDELEREEYPWELPCGALVFISPWQYRQVMIKLEGMELFPDHIIFAGSLEYLVEEALSRCNCRCKSIHQLGQVTSNASDVALVGSEVDAEDSYAHIVYECEFVVKGTFVHAQRVVRGSSRLTSSTTDAHLDGTANPRRASLVASLPL